MTVAEQVISVFTGVKGYLDDVELGKIKKFEKDIIEKIKSKKPELIESIQSTGKLDENTEKMLSQIIAAYKKEKNNAKSRRFKKRIKSVKNLHKKLQKL